MLKKKVLLVDLSSIRIKSKFKNLFLNKIYKKKIFSSTLFYKSMLGFDDLGENKKAKYKTKVNAIDKVVPVVDKKFDTIDHRIKQKV